jgi:biotin operon repressor
LLKILSTGKVYIGEELAAMLDTNIRNVVDALWHLKKSGHNIIGNKNGGIFYEPDGV